MLRFLILIGAAWFLSACAPQGLYNWGNYEEALYSYSKNPGELDKYVASLNAIVVEGDRTGKTPPGIYAEYGYALRLAGRHDEALKYFAKERDQWPEAATFMQLVIAGPQAAAESTPAVEGDQEVAQAPEEAE